MFRHCVTAVGGWLLIGLLTANSLAVELRQVISREHPAIKQTGSGLAVGRDGFVYVYGGQGNQGYVLRISRDGLQKFGMPTTYAITGVAAGADGTVATSNAHFAKSVSVYDRLGNERGKAGGFTGNDDVGWDGPGTIEVGASGDFFALDQHAGRIVRVSPAGQIVRSYPIRAEGETDPGRFWRYGFRVCEGHEQFYFIAGDQLLCRGFDGRRRSSLAARVSGDPWGGFSGGFDVDDTGLLYLNDGVDAQVRMFDADGKPAGELTLDMGDRTAGPQRRISHLRVFGDDIVVRQKSDSEVFHVYNRKTGAFRRAVNIEFEQLTVWYPSPVWTAGESIPLKVAFRSALVNESWRKLPACERLFWQAGSLPHVFRGAKGDIDLAGPTLNAWLRPLGTETFTRLAMESGQTTVPAQSSGLFQLRVGSGVDGSNSEYQVEAVVEIRPKDAIGSLSIFTPLNRRSYARGEEVPFSVLCRTPDDQVKPDEVVIRLMDADGRQLHQFPVELTKTSNEPVSGKISHELSSRLAAGQYRLTTTLPGWTIADQYLLIGEGFGKETESFYRIRHGDYSMAYPATTFFDAPEQIARHVRASRRLGQNLFVDRLGHGGSGGLGELPSTLRHPELAARLKNDPLAVAPEKAAFENRILQTVAAYGAEGIEQRAILLYMDAGLPIGTGHDKRPPEEMERDIRNVTERLWQYPAFRGWSWAANWWIAQRGAALAFSPEEKTAYEAAYKAALDTGRWDAVLETVSNRWIAHTVEAERRFSAAQQAVRTEAGKRSAASQRPTLVSAMTAPYRQPGMIPPLTFARADEVDLHFQAEQIQWPMISAHNVDFYRRPGKPAWGHPELWNDDGTGGQILSNSMQMVMRGANGIGQSGSTKGFASPETDPRGAGQGATSIHRRLNQWLAVYGPWLASLEASDPIAIPVSTRMLRMELGWQGVGGFYFTRLFEAYNACLRAHRPATFVFAEDCGPDSLSGFQAVLVVSQTVDLDPQLRIALQRAVAAGVPVFRDRSTRAELLPKSRLLDVEFTRIEQDHHLLNDDSAFWRYRDTLLGHAATLSEAWEDVVPPVAQCDHPEVLLTERRLGNTRVLWAVNDAAIPIDPALLWRVSLAAGSRMPVATQLKWPAAEGCQVYELFSGELIRSSGPLPVDLRHAPARILVAVPQAKQATPIKREAKAMEKPFAARLRDVVVSADNRTALVTAAGWDRNAFFVDLENGAVRHTEKVGHHFAYAPLRVAGGFAVQGYDLNTAEGYHLYLTDKGRPRAESAGYFARRFALYGLPKRGTGWASARQWQEPINSFAVAPDGTWVASAGDLGLVVWSQDGKRLWSDDWWPEGRERRQSLASDNHTLITLDGFTVTARDARSGQPRWSHELGETGTLTAAEASADGRTLALRSTARGGRVFILRDGQPAGALPSAADEMTLSPDGTFVAVTRQHELRLFDSSSGLRWSVETDDVLRSPRFSPDSRRIVVGSELGTLYVFDTDGKRLCQRDLGALPVANWLADGGLIVATWLGELTRLDSDYEPVWSTTLQSDVTIGPQDLLATDRTPTVRVDGWGNAAQELAPLTPNLLTETQALVEAWCDPPTHGDPRRWKHKIDLLRDGDPTAPPSPWLEWTDISYLDSGWRQKLVVQVDTFRSQLRLRGVTVVEDEAHPESWTRDMRLEWWDVAAEAWRDGPYLLSNQARHTHWFDKPLEAAKFRLVSTGGASWPVGNIRWGELVFHGDVLGPSHPDAVANRPVAVLFDEREDDLKHLMAYGDYPFTFRYDDAFSGGKSLALRTAGNTTANWRPPFGHVLPNWDFQVVEQPRKPGEYRWLEFAWKAASEETTGITLRVGPHHGSGVALSAGQATRFEGVVNVEHSDKPPTDWKTVRVDLWKLHGKPFSIRSLSLGAVGEGALFDRILLGRSKGDFGR
ncbi:MAG: hypothetical protein H8E44_24615 [Planctomycetes bacterium]|nr:hypothetical protein [Planctomycetota bacterium]MBL7040012.1 hypothetical protein [Pirellulaceae bacterium]